MDRIMTQAGVPQLLMPYFGMTGARPLAVRSDKNAFG